MTETQVNIPLLRKAVEWAEAEVAKPEIDREWNQMFWVGEPYDHARRLVIEMPGSYFEHKKRVAQTAAHCGTVYCIAGYVAQLVDPSYRDAEVVDGVHVGEFAANALGLVSEAGCLLFPLFSNDNTIADIRRIAEDIAGERL